MTNLTILARLSRADEFEIFQRAYLDWYGYPADLHALERDFISYLAHEAGLPLYVRDFLRRQHVMLA